MGLLDRIAKNAVSNLGKSIGSKLGDVLEDKIEQATGIDLTPNSVSASAASATAVASTTAGKSETAVDIKAKFDEILNSEFSSYEIRKSASAASLGITGAACKDYDYALIKGGRTMAVIMLTPHNRDNNAAFKNAKSNAAACNVAFINFYTHMDNERSYVISRIKSFL